MKAVRVLVSPELIFQAIPFPDGTEFLRIDVGEHGEVSLVVQHPDLPELPEGASPPLVTPAFRRQPPVILIDWGLSGQAQRV